MSSVNKVTILGRLGQDPELRELQGGKAVCNLSIATSQVWTDQQGHKNEKTEWHRVVVWGKLGELCAQYLAKGRQAYVEGRLETRSYEDQQGQKKYTTQVVASDVVFLGGGNDRSENRGGSFDDSPPGFSEDDEIPF